MLLAFCCHTCDTPTAALSGSWLVRARGLESWSWFPSVWTKSCSHDLAVNHWHQHLQTEAEREHVVVDYRQTAQTGVDSNKVFELDYCTEVLFSSICTSLEVFVLCWWWYFYFTGCVVSRCSHWAASKWQALLMWSNTICCHVLSNTKVKWLQWEYFTLTHVLELFTLSTSAQSSSMIG